MSIVVNDVSNNDCDQQLPISNSEVEDLAIMILVSLIWGLAGVAVVGASQARSNQYNLKPFTIDLSSNVEHMRDLINNSQLPREEEYPGVRADLGIPLGTLNELKDEWISQFDWEAEQKEMNRCFVKEP